MSPDTRRKFIAASVTLFSPLTLGCLSKARLGNSPDAIDEYSHSTTGTPAGTPAEGKTIAVDRTITDKHVKYLPEKKAVRVVTAYKSNESGQGRTPVYETIPFERWASVRSQDVAADGVKTYLEANYERMSGDIGVESAYNDGPTVRITTPKPVSEYEDLVSTAPSSVSVEITFEKARYETTVPVGIEHTTPGLD